MVTSSEDQTVKVWDTRSGIVQRNYQHTHPVNDVVIHPNQGELVSADRGGNIRVWDLGESKCTHQLIPAEDVSVSSVSVASDGSLLAAGNNKVRSYVFVSTSELIKPQGDVYIWRMFQSHDSTSLLPCRVFKAHKEYLTRLLLSPDVKNLATCSADHTVRIWKIEPTEENLEVIPEFGKNEGMSQLNGSTASFGKDSQNSGSINLKDVSQRKVNGSSKNGDMPENADFFRVISDLIANRRPLPSDVVLENHQRWVWDCAFSADSAYLVTVCSDHYARLWELQTAQIIRQYNGHHRGAVCVALNDYSEPR